MRILHVEDPFSVEERAEKKADIRQYVLPFWCLTLCKRKHIVYIIYKTAEENQGL